MWKVVEPVEGAQTLGKFPFATYVGDLAISELCFLIQKVGLIPLC